MTFHGGLLPGSHTDPNDLKGFYEGQHRIRACHRQEAGKPALRRLVEELGSLLGMARCLFFSISGQYAAFQLQAEYRRSSNIPPFPASLSQAAQAAMLQAANASQPPFMFNSLADEVLQDKPALSILLRQWDAQSGMLCLVENHGQAVGLLMALYETPRAWSQQELALALFAVDHLEIALPKTENSPGTIRMQAQIAENQERLALLLKGSNDAFWEWNIQTDQRYWNNRYYEILGLDPLVNQPSKELIWQLIHPDDIPLVEKSIQEVLETGAHYEIRVRLRHACGEYRYVLSRACCSRDEQGNPHLLAGAFTDITQWVQAEQTLQESEERFRAMADSSPVIIYVSDLQGTAYVNQYCLEFFGAELKQLHGSQWEHFIHPEDLEGFYQHCWEAGQRLAIFKTEVRARNYRNEYRWLLVTGAPRLLPSGEFTGYVGVALDITDLKNAQEELKTYAYQLEQSNRELEQFATIASHDLQEPLRKVLLFSHFIKETQQGQLSEGAQDYLSRIQKATERMQALITDLLDLSRIHRKGKPFRKVNLTEVLACVLSDLQYTLRDSGGQVEVGPLITLDADFKQMQQLFQNLIDNALKFHRKQEKPLVKIRAEMLNDQQCEFLVADNGIGFDEKYKDRIFGVFERLHSPREYAGTGIGLALCKKIVERHHGSIQVKSQPGQGTTFIIRLPIRQPNLD